MADYCHTHRVSLLRSGGWCPACQAVREDLAVGKARAEVAKWVERAERDRRYVDRVAEHLDMARAAHDDMLAAKDRARQCRDSFNSLILMGARQEPCPNDDEPRREQAQVEMDDARTMLVCGR